MTGPALAVLMAKLVDKASHFQVKLNFVFEKEKLLENNLQDNKIDTLLTNETHSMDDLIIELSFNQQINFQYSLKFNSLIKKIKDYFKQEL